MSRPHYEEFFEAATGGSKPYGYQCRLACGPNAYTARPETLRADTHCPSQFINIPTGLGKTAGVVLAWLWNRLAKPDPGADAPWPRRLVYCLPMRTLVEQTATATARWIANLLAAAEAGQLDLPREQREQLVWLHRHSPVILMGGEETDRDEPWDIHPEKPAILVGTQDMLLSRALNRGYGMSRYRWPMHFGLLNNDCLWVMDETQLMGVGLETSAQFAGFRERFGTLAPCVHWWMSATLDRGRMSTPEAPPQPAECRLTGAEQQMPAVQRRLQAVKRLKRAGTSVTDATESFAKALASEVLSAHIKDTLTLVILNTVERAQEVYRELSKQSPGIPATLLHSRFRPCERQALVDRVLTSAGEQIVISTQVVEAGVDLSARTLFTELAPWSSLVQRFGRCHRHGEMNPPGADILWIDVPGSETSPYAPEELAASRTMLGSLTEASLATLAQLRPPPPSDPPRHIVRPKDVRELFDTTPDIAGADLDISRFIREGEDVDCLVFWRATEPDPIVDGPARDELCQVPVGRLRELADKRRNDAVWVWDALVRKWVHPERFIPGRTYWLLATLGGYDSDIGFDRRSKAAVVPVPQSNLGPEALDDEPGTTLPKIETLAEHTAAVVARSVELCHTLRLAPALVAALHQAATWHDVGKAHPVFQAALRRANPALDPAIVYAKSGSTARLEFERPHFRHELASALAFRSLPDASRTDRALVSYVIAAHHGKVRLSLRAVPGEMEPPPPPDGTEMLFARGIWDGDTLPSLTIDGTRFPESRLSLAPMQIGLGPDGEPSWLESCVELRDSAQFGPFRLAMLETLLRAADMRASGDSKRDPKAGESPGVDAGMALRDQAVSDGTPGSLSPAEQALVAELVADGLGIQNRFRPEPLYKQTGEGHYESKAVEEIEQAKRNRSGVKRS